MSDSKMDANLSILFYIGIIIPTTITVCFFVGFLICWFRCGLKSRLVVLRSGKPDNTSPNNAESQGENVDAAEKTSQHSADSAIDVNDLEQVAVEDKMAAGNDNSQPFVSHSNAGFLTEADIHSNISRGIYPSHEKLNEEINSEPRIYETPEDLEIAIHNGFVPTAIKLNNILPPRPIEHPGTSAVTRCAQQYPGNDRILADRKSSCTSTLEDNHMTDYGFATWQRPSCIGAIHHLPTRGLPMSLSIPKTQGDTLGISWNKDIIGNTSVEILHV